METPNYDEESDRQAYSIVWMFWMIEQLDQFYGPCWRCEGMGV